MSWRIGRQLPFLRSVLREADQNVRRERLQHANADQINAISELVTNTLRGGVKVSPLTLNSLIPHEMALRNMARPRNSVKRRRQIMMQQSGQGLWKGLRRACESCLRR